ncbi:MAG TPA: amidohydrolase family protein, partial [Gemmatimonadales bacterium]|nr:amidohydrolase family protein [Gemmatimonadales bacterium]
MNRAQAGARPELILAGGDVLLHDGPGAWRVERGDVTVRDGRIAAIGKATEGSDDGKERRPSLHVRDCRGCLILPGLIQAHIHLCQTLFRGLADDLRLEDWLVRRIWPLEAAHTEETVYWSAMLGAAELALGGTTAILDMETVRYTGRAFEALERVGIRATAGKCLMDAHPEGAPLELAESTD